VSGEAFRLHPGNLRWNREDHAAAVDRVKHHIHEGDVYQINLTHSYDFEVGGSYAAFYRALRSRQTAGFSAYLDTGKRRIISHSPELFFRRRGDLLQARPMKGTAVRSETDTVHDRRWLAEDAKNRAENLMIVDLLRNDLSACCLPGSVRVKDLFHVESYETLYQMTSTIEGRLRPSISNSEIVRALFPCGSVTGAPKIRAMHLIADIEREPRGVYCGAIGFVSPERIAMFSVAIRTAEVDSDSGRGTIGTGSGIVWDSESRGEYDEGVLKLRFLTSVQE
jgi:para-aminobenzoate synthetase/4-amino-4-deoxychorismate lyase